MHPKGPAAAPRRLSGRASCRAGLAAAAEGDGLGHAKLEVCLASVSAALSAENLPRWASAAARSARRWPSLFAEACPRELGRGSSAAAAVADSNKQRHCPAASKATRLSSSSCWMRVSPRRRCSSIRGARRNSFHPSLARGSRCTSAKPAAMAFFQGAAHTASPLAQFRGQVYIVHSLQRVARRRRRGGDLRGLHAGLAWLAPWLARAAVARALGGRDGSLLAPPREGQGPRQPRGPAQRLPPRTRAGGGSCRRATSSATPAGRRTREGPCVSPRLDGKRRVRSSFTKRPQIRKRRFLGLGVAQNS